MRTRTRRLVRRLARRLDPENYAKAKKLHVNDLGFGYDPFGLEIESAMAAFLAAHLAYKHWFRVRSQGIERVPRKGPVLITPNHSGLLPLDAVMIAVDLVRNMEEPRIMRAVTDLFFGFLPYVNTFLYRCGQLIGARRNLEEVLRNGELLCLFPEGAKGTGKMFWERYQLRPFNVGFMELSLTYRAPIVPTAVIGGEEQYPMIYDIKPLARWLGFPYAPLTVFFPWLGPLGLIPLPTRYHITYGEPFHFYRDYPPETVRDPAIVRQLVNQVRDRVQEMVREGLEQRTRIF